MNITISENKRYFKKNNKKFFYFADTCWSAFTNIDLDSWEYYLQYRRRQGFNVLQINIQIDKILFVLFNSKVTFRDMKRRMVKNIH